jgi:DNA-binding transcriptional LysR family regulator
MPVSDVADAAEEASGIMSPRVPARPLVRLSDHPTDEGGRARPPIPSRAPGLTQTDLDLLRGLADTRNLRTTAKRAGVTQRVAERRLARLERQLDVQLVTPGSDDLQLTAAGERLLVAATRFRDELSKVVSQVLIRPETGGPPHLPTLRLAGIGRSWGDWVIDYLAPRMRKLVLTVVSADPDDGRELFERRGVDAVYLWHIPGQVPVLNRLSASQWVLDEPLWVTLPERHPAARQAIVSLSDLAEDEWIVGPGPGVDLLNTVCSAAGFVPKIGDVSASRSVRRSLLLHGHRVGLVSPVSMPPLGDTTMVRRPLREPVVRRHALHVDPTVVSPSLHALLLGLLRHGYVAVARTRNPEYADSPGFPLRAEDLIDLVPPADPEALRSLPSHVDSRQARRRDPHLDSSDLHLLRAIAASGSINRAASLLSITQPALSRRLSRLEERLGRRLLVRGPRGAALTEVGRRLVELAADSEAAFDSVLASLRSREPTALGSPASRACAASTRRPAQLTAGLARG